MRTVLQGSGQRSVSQEMSREEFHEPSSTCSPSVIDREVSMDSRAIGIILRVVLQC